MVTDRDPPPKLVLDPSTVGPMAAVICDPTTVGPMAAVSDTPLSLSNEEISQLKKILPFLLSRVETEALIDTYLSAHEANIKSDVHNFLITPLSEDFSSRLNELNSSVQSHIHTRYQNIEATLQSRFASIDSSFSQWPDASSLETRFQALEASCSKLHTECERLFIEIGDNAVHIKDFRQVSQFADQTGKKFNEIEAAIISLRNDTASQFSALRSAESAATAPRPPSNDRTKVRPRDDCSNNT